MKIDREIQREILERLAAVYPNGLVPLQPHIESTDDEQTVIANALYLAEHGLIELGYVRRSAVGLKPEDSWAEPRETKITANGIDFLLEDGGLGAILGVVTVKLDANTLMALVSSRIDQAQDLTHDEKTRAKTLLRSAGDQAIRKFVDMVMEKGLQAVEKTPQLIGMLQGALS